MITEAVKVTEPSKIPNGIGQYCFHFQQDQSVSIQSSNSFQWTSNLANVRKTKERGCFRKKSVSLMTCVLDWNPAIDPPSLRFYLQNRRLLSGMTDSYARREPFSMSNLAKRKSNEQNIKIPRTL